MASINDLATAAIASSAVALTPGGGAGAAGGAAVAVPAPGAGDGGAGGAGAAPPSASTAERQPTPQPTPEQQQQPVRGALIVLEGLDRSGKTTQVKLLEQRFVEAGKKVKVLRFPDRTTPIGQMIDAYLKSQAEMDDHVVHLLFSANRWEAVRTVAALLAAGTTVLCDRYYHSGIVYSAAKRNPALSLGWARAPEVGLPRPDLVLFLDLDEDQARARGGWGGELYEKAEMQRRVRELFWGLSMGRVDVDGGIVAESGESGESGEDRPGGKGEVMFRQEEEDLSVVDASPSVEEVAEAIWGVVRPRVELVERGELGRAVRKIS